MIPNRILPLLCLLTILLSGPSAYSSIFPVLELSEKTSITPDSLSASYPKVTPGVVLPARQLGFQRGNPVLQELSDNFHVAEEPAEEGQAATGGKDTVHYNFTPYKPNYRNPDSKFYADTAVNKKRTWTVCGLAIGTYTAVYGALGAAWYAGQPTTSFHWFKDINEWKQMDKTGHVLGGYLGSAYMIRMMKWAGHKKSTTLWVGGITGFLMVNTIEVFDGFSPAYGASPSDLGFNALGSITAVANELLWNEQRLQWKISYHPTDWYKQRPDLLGTGVERLVKDYNGHTFWMSARVHSFLPEGKFKRIYPKWLNVAVGYGAEGLIGGWGDPDPAVQAAIAEREYRQFYLSLDIDLSMIETKSPFLDFLLGTINFIHLPMPAMEMSKHGVRFRPVFM